MNVFFAALYWLAGPEALSGAEQSPLGRFEDCLFFSVQTIATIGYGRLVPHTRVANILVAIEATFTPSTTAAAGNLNSIWVGSLSRSCRVVCALASASACRRPEEIPIEKGDKSRHCAISSAFSMPSRSHGAASWRDG